MVICIDATLDFVQNGPKPSLESFRSLLQASIAFIEKIKQESNNHALLEEIRKAADASMRWKTFIEEQIIDMKNFALTSNLLYSKIASQGAANFFF